MSFAEVNARESEIGFERFFRRLLAVKTKQAVEFNLVQNTFGIKQILSGFFEP